MSDQGVDTRTLPGGITINVPAPPPVQPTALVPGTPEFDAYINGERERVRKEEKDKLYPRIDELQGQLKVLNEERDAKIKADEEAARLAAEEEKTRKEAEMTTVERFEAYRTEQDQRFAELQADRERDRAVLDKEREFARLNEYRLTLLRTEADNIAPQLIDLVGGNNEEEIAQSVLRMKQKTTDIATEMREAITSARPRPVMPISGTPPIDSGLGTQQRTLTPEDIRAMGPEEWSRVRGPIMEEISRNVHEKGVYGI